MQNKLVKLINSQWSLRSLREIQSVALAMSDAEPEPLGYYLISSFAGMIAQQEEGEAVEADYSEVKENVIRPMFLGVLNAANDGDYEKLVHCSNAAIKGILLTKQSFNTSSLPDVMP